MSEKLYAYFESRPNVPILWPRVNWPKMVGGVMKELDFIMKEEEKERVKILAAFAEDFYRELGIDPPMELWESDKMTDLLQATSKTTAAKILRSIKKDATKYHAENVEKIYLDKEVTIRTLFKIIKKTPYGDKLNHMGAGGTTVSNLKENFITKPALDLAIYLMAKSPPLPEIKREFPKNRDYIADQFRRLKKKQTK